MKKIPFYAFTILMATLIIAALPTDAEAEIYEDTIRLHILANSDSEKDQALKIAVRDGLLNEYGERLRSAGSFEAAELLGNELLPEIEEKAKEILKSLGCNLDVKATITTEWYETREYSDFALPAGYYTSLRVIIGSGEGKNWWCVMYPPLCMELATESAPADDGIIDYTREEISLIKSGKYNIKFKILEEVSRLFAKNG
jgi:stage II sporulation protein R